MASFAKSLKSGLAAALIAVMAANAVAPAMAQDRGRRDWRGDSRPEWRGDRHWGGAPRAVIVRPRPSYYRPYPLPRSRYYNHVRVYRPYGRPYPGFGFYYRDSDALRFLGLTALGLIIFNQLNEVQQRAHEEALKEATIVPIGDAVIWNQSGRSGSVTPVRDGVTPDGRACREFRQEVIIGGDRTEAYGTACQQPDGSWQVVNN